MADKKEFGIRKYYNQLTRMFQSGPVVYNRVANKVAPPGQTGVPIGTARAFLKNTHNSYASSVAAYGSYNRLSRYSSYQEMESLAECASALDIYAEETCVEDEYGDLLRVESSNMSIKKALYSLFYDTLNIKFNGPMWVRNLCKYGDAFFLLDHHPDYGVLNLFTMPVNEVEREEGYDPDNPLAYRYRWLTQGNRVLDNWQVIHFRLFGNDVFNPYGTSILEPARRVWRQLVLLEDAIMVYRIVRSAERRVFYIDVGNVAPQEIPQYVQQAQKQMKRNMVVDNASGRVDQRYNVMCHSLNNIIYLRDGRTITLKNIIDEWESGKQNHWVYSIDRENNKLVPGKVVWAGITRKDAQLVRVHLDDGIYIDVTPDHKIMMRDKRYIEAQYLNPGDALMPLYRKKERIVKNKKNVKRYWKIYDPFKECYCFDHRIVTERSAGKLLRIPVERRFKKYKQDALDGAGYKNHKVIKVEWLEKRENTGCITVEKYHNFATAGHKECYSDDVISKHALTTGIYTKNSMEDDFWIPTRGEHSSRIESLPGGQYVGDVQDVQYIQAKLFAALKIPKSYLGFEGDISAKSTLSQEDVRFAKTIQRIQNVFIAELNKIAIIHLYSMGFQRSDLTNFTLSMANPSTISELQRLELWRTKFEVASMIQEGAVDRDFVYRKLFKLSSADIEQIEEGRRKDKMFDMEIENIQPPMAPEMAAPPAGEEMPPPEEPGAAAASPPEETPPPPPGGLPPPPGEEAGTIAAAKDPNAQRAAPNELMKVTKLKKKSVIPNLHKYAFGTDKTAMDNKRNRSELTRLVKNPFGEDVDYEEKHFQKNVARLERFIEDLDKVDVLRPAGKKNTKKVISD